MSWNNIRQEISTNIADNDQQLITAEKVRTTLIDIVNETETIEDEIYEEMNTLNNNFDNYYTSSQVDDEIDNLHNITWGELMQQVTICKNYTNSYCNSYFYDKEWIDNIEENIYSNEDDLDDRLSVVERSYANKSYVSSYYYDKTDSDKLYKPTGLFFYFGDQKTDECSCTVSYVNLINEDGPSGDFYLIDGYARYGGDNSLVFNINRPYGPLYSCTYTMGLWEVAYDAFTKALGTGHTPQIHKFEQNITVNIDYPDIQGNGIIIVGNINCDDEYTGEFTFSLVSAYEHTNLPLIINVGFRCFVQDAQ